MKTLFLTVLAIALVSAAPSPINGAAAPGKRQDRPAPKGNPWGPWTGDKVKRIMHSPDDDKVKRSDETTEGNPWTPWHGNPWTDDKEKRQHEPHAEGNPWGPWTEDEE